MNDQRVRVAQKFEQTLITAHTQRNRRSCSYAISRLTGKQQPIQKWWTSRRRSTGTLWNTAICTRPANDRSGRRRDPRSTTPKSARPCRPRPRTLRRNLDVCRGCVRAYTNSRNKISLFHRQNDERRKNTNHQLLYGCIYVL